MITDAEWEARNRGWLEFMQGKRFQRCLWGLEEYRRISDEWLSRELPNEDFLAYCHLLQGEYEELGECYPDACDPAAKEAMGAATRSGLRAMQRLVEDTAVALVYGLQDATTMGRPSA